MAQFDLKKATVKLIDGAANELTLKIANGTLSYTEKRNIEYIKDRGALDSVREGDEEPVEVKLDVIWEFLKQGSGGEPITPEDAFKKRGGAAAWVSADTADPCAPYSLDIEVTYDPDCSPTQVETITIADFRHESLDHSFKDGMISVSGKANVDEATPVRS